MQLSKAVQGLQFHMASGGYSSRTVTLYQDLLKHLVDFLNDTPIEAITADDLKRFMTFMKIDYRPSRFGGNTDPISPAYLDNHWKAIRTFFKWAAEILSISRPDEKLPRPKYKSPEVLPFTENEIKKILSACDFTQECKRANTKSYRLKRKTALRDRALIMIMLDTGVRIGELNRLKVEDVDLATGTCLIAPFETGRKTKPRVVYLGKTTRRSLWLYLAKRKDYDPDDPLIPLGADPIRLLLKGIEERSGVTNIHPHRFRHTFAIQYLRNKGDVFTLQRLLGHATLTMVQHYLALVNADSAEAHRRASPVDNMRI